MISIKYLYVIIPVLILLIGIIWSIIHMSMSKKKVIKNTNPVFISTKGATKKEHTESIKEHKREIKLEDKHAKRIAEKKTKESKKNAKADKKKAYREAKKKAKADKKKSKKSKQKHKTE